MHRPNISGSYAVLFFSASEFMYTYMYVYMADLRVGEMKELEDKKNLTLMKTRRQFFLMPWKLIIMEAKKEYVP